MESTHLAENLLFLTAFVAALLPLAYALKRRLSKALFMVLLALAAVALLLAVPAPSRDAVLANAVPDRTVRDGMLPSDSCIACHPGQYQAWHDSFHRTMTQVAGPDSVIAPFDGRTLTWNDKSFVVNRRDNEYWVAETSAGELGGGVKEADSKRVVMTTGSRHQQIYWTLAPNGALRQFPWVYEIAMARWIPSEHTFMRPDDWKQYTPTWNQDCIRCHSVGALPNYISETDSWETEVTELGIACASCHGPGEDHIRAHQNPIHRYLERIRDRPDPTIVNPRRLSQARSSEVCGQCHAFALLPGGFHSGNWASFRAGKQLEEHFRLSSLENSRSPENMFWPDGTARTGGREYNSMTQSGCFTRGQLTCLSCHALHGDEPLDLIASSMNGNRACLQCHTEYEDNVTSHTRHAAASSGSECMNCHMPYTGYALLAAVRSHRIASPTTSGITSTDQPNACNLCHLDKTLAWTADHLAERIGAPAVELIDEQGDHRRRGAVGAARRCRPAGGRRLAHGPSLGAGSIRQSMGAAIPVHAVARSLFGGADDRASFVAAGDRGEHPFRLRRVAF